MEERMRFIAFVLSFAVAFIVESGKGDDAHAQVHSDRDMSEDKLPGVHVPDYDAPGNVTDMEFWAKYFSLVHHEGGEHSTTAAPPGAKGDVQRPMNRMLCPSSRDIVKELVTLRNQLGTVIETLNEIKETIWK